jgi:large subunit ribosomal protein L29
MKAKELKDLTLDELIAKRQDFRQELLNLRLQQQGGHLEKPSRIRELRKDVARVETLLSARRIAAAASAEAKK